ncbi:hypothetical protein ABE437_15955 [Isoptericola cucumis]|uniref:hypothetical protein n=1 Tax=Isoptericola cucumis TaxID=1776856 RepID=UPI00320AB5E3
MPVRTTPARAAAPPAPTSPPSAPTSPPPARFTPPDLVDLRTAWTRERELARRPDTRHDDGFGVACTGRHGWLLDDGYDAVLEPALGPNAGVGAGYYPFAALDGTAAAGLLERLPEEYLATERQNLGPTIGAVLRAVVRRPDRLRAQGYVVGPLRCDERITVTEVLLRTDHELHLDRRHSGPCECHDLFTLLTGELGVDDMHTPPDEIAPWWGRVGADDAADDGADDDTHWYRLWWD